MGQPEPAFLRVMLCDDSATVRAALTRVLAADPAIRVVKAVGDGLAAVEAVRAMAPAERPDVILLDLEMPVMDGMTALPQLLRASPGSAVIVASALSQRGAAATMQALRSGAVDYVPKPAAVAGGVRDPAFQAELLAKVKGWARMRRRGGAPPTVGRTGTRPQLPATLPARPRAGAPQVVAIGSSTGGPQALATLVSRIDRPLPAPIVVVQHMPAGFTALLADHLGRLGPTACAEATDGEELKSGRLYLAPGDRHLLIEAQGPALVARLSDGPPVNFCRPAVDPTLRSLVSARGGRILAAILTGMGQDGLEGCRAVAAAGGLVLAQDEASSVVWGMPGAVARAGLAQALLPPDELGSRITAMAAAMAGARA